MDMAKYTKDNDGITFILLVIDIFSKYVWLQPLQKKTGAETAKAFSAILQTGRKPKRLRTDKGNMIYMHFLKILIANNFVFIYRLGISPPTINTEVI